MTTTTEKIFIDYKEIHDNYNKIILQGKINPEWYLDVATKDGKYGESETIN